MGAGLFSLARNIGAAIGVVRHLVDAGATTRSSCTPEIGAYVTPFNRALHDNGAVQQHLDPATKHGAAMLDHMIQPARRRSSRMSTTTR